MENKQSIIERHTTEIEPGIKKLDLINIILELDARIKTVYTVLDEMKKVIAGQAAWSEATDLRLKKLEPTIQVYSENDVKTMLNRK